MTYFKGHISYKFQDPGEWYDPAKGHTGCDYVMPEGTSIQCPVEGVVTNIQEQEQMGLTLYIKDQQAGRIHVFAHLSEILVKKDHVIEAHQFIARSGNTGTATKEPHLHYEIISPLAMPDKEHMTRELAGFSGYNIDPETFLKIQHWSYESMTWMLMNDLIGKMHDPKETLMWGEFCVMIRRFADKLNGNGEGRG